MSNEVSQNITVSRDALYQVLRALIGQPYLLGELRATRSLHRLGHPNPIETLIEQFNAGGVTPPQAAPAAVAGPAQCPTSVDAKTMELAESVGLIGPASRVHDLHAAIQRFHDLICANATIKAAVMSADVIRGAATSVRDYPPLPMQFACSGVFPVYSADQMRAYVDADRAMLAQAAPAAVAGPSEVQELRAIAAFLGGAKDRLGRPDAAANDEMRTARETIRAAAVRRGVAGGHHTYIDQCAAVLAALANKIGGVA